MSSPPMSTSQRADLARDLASRIRGEVRHDATSRMLYATDASVYQVPPALVVIPRAPEDLAAILAVARERRLSVVARGAGTSLEGQTVGHGIQVDFSRFLNRVLAIDPEGRTALVEPGIVLDHLNAALAPHGLMFGPDVATTDRATVGGMIGNNSSGARSLVYGKTVDHVVALEAVLADGTLRRFDEKGPAGVQALLEGRGPEPDLYRAVIRRVRETAPRIVESFPRILRRVSGYNLDEMLRGLRAVGEAVPEWTGPVAPQARSPEGFSLARLLVGSEGTLGLTTRATLNLVPRPEAVGLLVTMFSSRDQALEANLALLELQPTALELMDRNLLDLARAQREMARNLSFLEGQPEAVLIAEFAGPAAGIPGRLDEARQHLQARGMGYAWRALVESEDRDQVWKVRKAGLPLLLGIPGRRKPIAFVEDTAVAPERLLEFVRRFDRIMEDHGTRAACYAHASVGCLHLRPLLDLKCAEDVGRMASISEAVTDLVMSLGGALSGEHGDGRAHSSWLPRLFGSEIYQVFQAIKGAFDPDNLLNPGNIVEAPSLTENLRYGPAYRAESPETALDWSAEGGFDLAVEQCNGAGVCRKTQAGTMCPSFQVTRDEEHSTRGRANALRAALSGALPSGALTSKRMLEVLDLCVQCKGCKSECPSNVDLAKIKFEVMVQYYKENPVPLRTRLFANAELLARIGCATAPLSNWFLASPLWPPVARMIGVAPQRRLPPYARPTFDTWWRRRPGRPRGQRPVVALFVDTWANYNEPQVARAAVRLLEAAGFAVEPARKVCCGRAAISKGLIEPVRRAAWRNLELLSPYVEAGIPIVGLEPSCILTLREEYPWLYPGERSRALARGSFTFEEFLAGRDLPLRPGPSRVLVHGHCHQKSLVGMAPLRRLLSGIPGLEVQEVDSGCCGMAGAFGYEAEHYELSQAMGGQRLFPAVEKARREGLPVVAPGTSCRHQIWEATGVRALHPSEFLAGLVESQAD